MDRHPVTPAALLRLNRLAARVNRLAFALRRVRVARDSRLGVALAELVDVAEEAMK